MNLAVSLILGLIFGGSLVAFVTALRATHEPVRVDIAALRPLEYTSKKPGFAIDPVRVGVSVIVGLGLAVFTTWPVFGFAAAVVAYGLPALFAGDGFADHVGRTDAIATWIESLRDAMDQARSLEGALRETALAAPEAIAVDLQMFVDEVDHGILIEDGLVNLSDRLEHEVSDLALAALVTALNEGASGVRSVLSQAADECRRMAADSNEVYASRASSRTTVRMILGIVIFSSVFFVVLFRDYLAPYGTGSGQLVLALVLLWFGGCGAAVGSLAKYRPKPRLLRPGRLVEPS